MMRQESPSPNSTLSSSALAAAKPPTPTSSPKLRRRTMSGGSGDHSIVRQNLEIEDDETEKSSVPTKSKRSQQGRRDSPSESHLATFASPSAQTAHQNSGGLGVPVVHDKRRSSAGASDQIRRPESEPVSGSEVHRSPTHHRSSQRSPSRDRPSSNRLDSNKCVKRTQSLKEQLVKKFSTVFIQSKNPSSSSSSPPLNANHPSASPSSPVDKQKPSKVATSSQMHAQPVISGSRRSLIPQPTTPSVAPPAAAFGNGCVDYEPETTRMDAAVTDPAPLYSPRQFVHDDVRSSDEIQISYDVNLTGNQLRVVKGQEPTPFRSHPVDRCGVVVPSGPSSSSKAGDADSDRARQGSPISDAAGSGKKASAPRVGAASEFAKSLAFSPRQKMNRNRAGSLRHNVQQVLPDKKLLRDKASSNENLSAAASDLPGDAPVGVPPPASSPVPAGAQASSLVPRPPMTKRPSTDSDDNSAPEPDPRNPGNGAASLPPRGRLGIYAKVKKGSSSAGVSNGAANGSGSAPRSAPILIGGGKGRDGSPSADTGLLLSSARPDDSSDNDSLEDGAGNTSDGDLSPKGSGGAEKSLPPSARQKSNSLEVLYAENPTVPKIRQPSARLSSRQQSGAPGSPPKSVTWNLVPDVVNYDKDLSAPNGAGEGAANGVASSSSRHHHHHHHHHSRHKSDIPFASHSQRQRPMRHASSDERLFDVRQGIANNTLIAVHETLLKQMTMLLKDELQLLEEVKQEKKSMTVYREVMQKILNMKAETVKRMQDMLEHPEA